MHMYGHSTAFTSFGWVLQIQNWVDTGASHRGRGVKLPTSMPFAHGKCEAIGGKIMPLNEKEQSSVTFSRVWEDVHRAAPQNSPH